MAPVPGQKLPQVVAPTPNSRGFMPVSNTGVAQRPGIGSMQPISNSQAGLALPTTPPAVPLPTVQTADTSNVPSK